VFGELLTGGRPEFEERVENLEAALVAKITGRLPRHSFPLVVRWF